MSEGFYDQEEIEPVEVAGLGGGYFVAAEDCTAGRDIAACAGAELRSIWVGY